MLYILAILFGILIGVLAKGKISNLANISFKKGWLFIVAFILLIASELAGNKYELINNNLIIFQGLVFCFILAGFWFNRQYAGIWAVAAGCLMNALAMLFNGGKMPVSLEVVEKANLMSRIAETGAKHAIVPINGGTRLPFLCDIIYLPNILGFLMKIISIGDLFVVLGLFLIVLQVVLGKGESRIVTSDNTACNEKI